MNWKLKSPREQRFEDWLNRQGILVRVIVLAGMLLCVYASWKVAQAAYQGLVEGGITHAPAPSKAQSSTPDDPTQTAEQSLNPDPSAVLNPAWKDPYGSSRVREHADGMSLSGSGYPIIVAQKPTPVCTGPIRLQLAMDLYVAQRSQDVDKMPDCIVLTPETRAEWTNPNPFNNGLIELRLHPRGALPVTVYGPSGNGSDSPFFRWFGSLRR